MPQFHDDLPRFDHLIGIGGTQHHQAWNSSQRRQLFDRLVRGPILTQADRIVREDVDDRNLHDRAQANGPAQRSR